MNRWIMAALASALLISVALAQTGGPVYLPLIVQPAATPSADRTPTPQPTSGPIDPTAIPLPGPPSYNNCQADPNAPHAAEFPVRIVEIDKDAEMVMLQNVSTSSIDLSGWIMCSITGNQQHPIGGRLAPGQTQVFPGPAGNIWNNSEQDDGALYDPQGRLISYLACATSICRP